LFWFAFPVGFEIGSVFLATDNGVSRCSTCYPCLARNRDSTF
jgi:hypothetical protein